MQNFVAYEIVIRAVAFVRLFMCPVRLLSFESIDLETSFFGLQAQIPNVYVKFVCQGHCQGQGRLSKSVSVSHIDQLRCIVVQVYLFVCAQKTIGQPFIVGCGLTRKLLYVS